MDCKPDICCVFSYYLTVFVVFSNIKTRVLIFCHLSYIMELNNNIVR